MEYTGSLKTQEPFQKQKFHQKRQLTWFQGLPMITCLTSISTSTFPYLICTIFLGFHIREVDIPPSSAGQWMKSLFSYSFFQDYAFIQEQNDRELCTFTVVHKDTHTEIFHSLIYWFIGHNKNGLGQAESRRMELHPEASHGRQGPKHWRPLSLPSHTR